MKNLVEPNKSSTFALAIQKWLLRLKNGVLTERLGNGLQNRVERFDSARHLFRKKEIHSFEFPFFSFISHSPLNQQSRFAPLALKGRVATKSPNRTYCNKTILQGAYDE